MAPVTSRSSVSSYSVGSRMSGRSVLDTERMDELKQCKNQLEEALRQVKAEMKAGGAKSTARQSTSRTSNQLTARSGVSTASSAMPTDWQAWGRGLTRDQGLSARR